MHIMEILDHIFLVEFARSRRKIGDTDLELAWRRASYRVSMYLGAAFAAVMLAVVLVSFALSNLGAPIGKQHKLLIQIICGAIFVVVCMCLDRRFKRFELAPPNLTIDESPEDKQLALRFRALSIGSIFLVLLLAHVFSPAR